jgi:hypothetical protein
MTWVKVLPFPDVMLAAITIMNTSLPTSARPVLRTGWTSGLARSCLALLVFEIVSGLAITFARFSATLQWTVLIHTLAGLLMVVPVGIYTARHYLDYRRQGMSQVVVLGWVALWSLLVCLGSGLVVTGQALFGIKTTVFWRGVHFYSTLALAFGVVPHVLISFARVLRGEASTAAWRTLGATAGGCVAGGSLILALAGMYSGVKYVNEFPEDYHFLYGTNRPFAPSLATTDTGGAFDERTFAGSRTCGTAGCHEQIVGEWLPSAHRYAALDPVFQGIQKVMADQNGPESTRYCGGCHDPISLFSGSKNLFTEKLTGSHGYDEGISCLACHAITSTDIKGNAHYTVTQPNEYLWQWETNGLPRVLRDFLIRSYPAEHNRLSKRTYKRAEYCAACHKQFIDEEVNRVGWVQLQNQYDNWAASHWNVKGDLTRTVECRECHMPLVDSIDPAAGDSLDYNRSPKDGKHRSHRFLAANQLIPKMMKLEGWEEHTRLTAEWLEGKIEIPEIAHKWRSGPIVKLSLQVPAEIEAGMELPLRVVMTSHKVGHDFPTGPLDIIQSWLEVIVRNDRGDVVFASGRRDENHFIEPGSFLFKAEPVDQYGNLIDRHNLWEMVGVRFRRALFPGYSDTAQFVIPCPSALAQAPRENGGWEDEQTLTGPVLHTGGTYHVRVQLLYRKVDQSLLNYLFGAERALTSPVATIDTAEAVVTVKPASP